MPLFYHKYVNYVLAHSVNYVITLYNIAGVQKDSAYQNQQKVAQEKLSQSPAQVFHILLRRENQSVVNQQQQSRIIHKAIQILQSSFRLIRKFSVLKRLQLQQ